jgi:hypothetical protein
MSTRSHLEHSVRSTLASLYETNDLIASRQAELRDTLDLKNVVSTLAQEDPDREVPEDFKLVIESLKNEEVHLLPDQHFQPARSPRGSWEFKLVSFNEDAEEDEGAGSAEEADD